MLKPCFQDRKSSTPNNQISPPIPIHLNNVVKLDTTSHSQLLIASKTLTDAGIIHDGRTCFMGGLHIHLTEKELIEHLHAHYPHIIAERVWLLRSKWNPEVNKGFGFVTFRTESDFMFMLEREFLLKGKRTIFRKAKKQIPETLEKRIVVKNVHRKANDHELKMILEGKGWAVERCYIVTDSLTLKSKGLAFVDFHHSKDMMSCLESTRVLKCRGKTIFIERYKQRKKKTGGKKVSKKNKLKNKKGKDFANLKNKLKKRSSNSQFFEEPEENKRDLWDLILSRPLNEKASNYRFIKHKDSKIFNRAELLLYSMVRKV